jgi:hypothetical protein
MADIKVTDFQILYGGKFTESGFETERNEMRFGYSAIADARFRKSSALALPQEDDDGNVLEGVISLSDEQVNEIKDVIVKVLAGIDFDPEFGPAG